MSVLVLLALSASAASAWSLWRRVLDALPHPDVPVPPSADRRRTVGGAALLGVLAALAVVGDRAPLATALAACLAWTAVSVWTALGAGDAAGVEWSPRSRRSATAALFIAVLPVSIGTLLAVEAPVYGSGTFGLLAGWLAAGAVAPWAARLGGDRDALAAPVDEAPRLEPDATPLGADARYAGGWRGLDDGSAGDRFSEGPPPLPRPPAPADDAWPADIGNPNVPDSP